MTNKLNATTQAVAQPHSASKAWGILAAAVGIILVAATFIWQGIVTHGNPDPGVPGMNRASQVMSSGVLVFREGLEAILVLSTVTAGMARSGRKDYLTAVPIGAGTAFVATIATWFLVVAIISHVTAPEYSVQAGTGLVAIIVLLVVMNWFFHKIYWTGWISNLSEQRQKLLVAADENSQRTYFGLALLGFAAIYREGFEIVLFLQDLRLKAGNGIVLEGTGLGLGLTLIVAALTFVAHKKLPYKKMLIVTGILLGIVLLIMVGEEAQEMQQAGWIHTTPIHVAIPDWLGVWFSIFPTVQTIAAQVIAATLVIGSYFSASLVRVARPRKTAA